MQKVVFDSNIYISGIFFGGKPRDLMNFAINKQIKLFSSEFILKEIEDYLKVKTSTKDKEISIIITKIRSYAKVICISKKYDICRDSKDNHILDCAKTVMAGYVVTGDKDLLIMKKFDNIVIINTSDFLDQLR
jgi:uncharacterized protein